MTSNEYSLCSPSPSPLDWLGSSIVLPRVLLMVDMDSVWIVVGGQFLRLTKWENISTAVRRRFSRTMRSMVELSSLRQLTAWRYSGKETSAFYICTYSWEFGGGKLASPQAFNPRGPSVVGRGDTVSRASFRHRLKVSVSTKQAACSNDFPR